MDLGKERFYVAAAMVVAFLKYVPQLVLEPICNWDCGFYVRHLALTDYSQFHTFIEPLYFYVFKPLTLVFHPVMVVRLSQALMLPVLFYGTYILARRFGLRPLYAGLAVVTLSFLPGTERLWSDTLRNFLGFSLLPYFVYFYMDPSKRYYSYAFAILMALSHRTVLLIFPVVVAYEYTQGNLKQLAKTLGILTAPLLLVSLATRDTLHLLHPVISITTAITKYVPTYFIQNAKWFNLYGGIGLLGGVYAIYYGEFDTPTRRFLYLFFVLFAAGAVFFNHFTAGRLVLVFTLPAAIMTAYGFQIWREDRTGQSPHIMAFILIAILFAGVMGGVRTNSAMDQYEMDFIDDLDRDIPDGALVFAPSRLGAYTEYALREQHRVDDIDYYDYIGRNGDGTPRPHRNASLYYGTNPFNETVYILDGDHWKPNSTTPLVLKRVSPDGSSHTVRESVPPGS